MRRALTAAACRIPFRGTLAVLALALAAPWVGGVAIAGAQPGPAPAAGAARPGAPPQPGAAAAPAQPVVQGGPGGPGGGNVETDPIRCWTRSSAGAVRIGEVFTVTLTCAVLETELVQVVPDETKLAVTVAQMNPFEVAGGNHPADIRTNSRRFFQYDYRIRMINPDSIGQDVAIPLLQVSYRINSRVPGAGQALQGRELAYILQPIWVKVLSIVPRDANDIRDTGDASFGRIEAIQFRAGVLEIVATTLVVLGTIMTLLALLGLVRRARKSAKTPEDRMLSRPALLRLAARELSRVQQEGAGGWTDPLVNRAMSALRISAAGALDRPISQRFVGRDDQAGEGRFIVNRLVRRKRIAVSAAVTAEDVAKAIERLRENASASRRQLLEELQASLSALSAAQYARPGTERRGLDETVDKAASLARQVRSQHSWLRESLRRVTMRLPMTQPQA